MIKAECAQTGQSDAVRWYPMSKLPICKI